jgi:hypothetical protein
VRAEVLTAVRMMELFFFSAVAPCRLVGRYQCFGETQFPSSGLKMDTECFCETLCLRVCTALQLRTISLCSTRFSIGVFAILHLSLVMTFTSLC